MAAKLKLEIVTPQGIVFANDVDLVTLPAADGEIGIYPQHVRLITQLVPGEIIVSKTVRTRTWRSAKAWCRWTPRMCRFSPTWPFAPMTSMKPR